MKRVLYAAPLLLAGVCLGFALALIFHRGLANILSSTGFKGSGSSTTSSQSSSNVLLLTISAIIDGSDRFIFTKDNVWNEHGQWQAPKNVLFNGEPWTDLSAPPSQWEKIAPTLDLAHAALIQRKGRDVIVLEHTPEGFDIYFADTPMGSGPYEATISVPLK
jgi:hypothetical protein